nr:thioredoxin domain-containing protein [Corynebacterium mendelii]
MDTDPFAIGDVDAPVVIVEYSDFECPFCAEFVNAVEPSVISDYVTAGKVRLEWNDFPVNGETAMAAARAGRAAAEQGYFNEFKHALYAASKDVSGHPNNSIDDFVAFAEEAKIPDLDKFRADAESDKYDEYINNSRQFAVSLGMTGTPTILVGNQPVPGNITPEEMAKTIDEQLEKIEAGDITPTEPGTTDGNDYDELVIAPQQDNKQAN